MKCQFLLCLITYFFTHGMSSQLFRLNTMSLVYPCKDNKKITMIVDNGELMKQNFRFLLTIERIPPGSYQIVITFDDENKSGSNFLPEHIFKSKKKSFSSDFYGTNGKFPKLRSVFIDNINFCKVPDEPVSLSSGSTIYHEVPPIPSPISDKVETSSPSNYSDIITQILAQNLTQAHIIQEPMEPTASECSMPKNTCGTRQKKYTELIVDGYDSKPGDWPWHVALYKFQMPSIKYICGGTLVSQSTIVTAAHCVTQRGVKIGPETIFAVLGKFHLYGGDENPQQRKVKEIIVNENFNSTSFKDDIALLKLETPAIFNNYVQPACIWQEEYENRFKSSTIVGMVAGWGFNQAQSLSLTLQQASLPKIKSLDCVQSQPTFFSRALNDNNFCAGYQNGTSPCNGDSGGGYHVFISDNTPKCPKQGKWYLHGIVSTAIARTNEVVCDPNHYALFTNVGKFVSWINNNL